MTWRGVLAARRLPWALALAGVLACGNDAPVIVLRMTSWQTPAENALDLPAIRQRLARR